MRLNVGLWRLVGSQIVRYWYWYAVGFAALLATQWTQSHLPFLAKDLAQTSGEGSRSISYMSFLWPALGILLFRTLSRLLFFYPARLTEEGIRLELLKALEQAPPPAYREHSEGQIFQTVSMDVESVRALLGFAFLQISNVVIASVVLLPKLWDFEPALLQGMIPMLLALLIFSAVVSRNYKLYRKMQNAQGEVQNFIMESYEGKKTIKNFHAEKSFIGLFKERTLVELKLFFTASQRVAFSMPLIPLGVGLSLVWGAHIVFTRDLGTGALVLFSGFTFLLLEPLSYVSWMGVVVARAIGCWDRIRELLWDLNFTPPLEEGAFFREGKDLCFKLDFWGGKVPLRFPTGRWGVLVGATGHGKSYLLEEMALQLKSRGVETAYVAQSPYLYNDTIGGNIFLGRAVDDKMRRRALELLDLFDLRYLFRGGTGLLDVEVGEHGKLLSGGQIKRLALVRSLLAEAEVLLWDDPFSAVDVILEKEIVGRLKSAPELTGATVLLTSHRLTTVRRCDRITFVDKGLGVVEWGTPYQLLNFGSETNEYFSKQII